MAGINDILGTFAAGALDKAGGTNFQAGMVEEARQRDRLVFQQRQMQMALDRERTRAKGERLQSQRGLLQSLKATGAFRDEDYTAVGGVDSLASLEPGDFEVALSQMKENRLRDLSTEEKRKVIEARAAAHDLVLSPNAPEKEVLIMEERLNMLQLDRADRKMQEKEARADAHLRLSSTQSGFQELLQDPTQVNEGTIANMEGTIEADTRYLSNLQGVDPDDLALLTQQHEQNRRTTQRARTMAAATDLANGTRGEILDAWAKNPGMRSALRVHEQVMDARRAVESGFKFIQGLDPARAEFLGLSGLQKVVKDAGGLSGVYMDGGLAEQVAALNDRAGDYSEQLQQREEDKSAKQEAAKASSGMKAVLGDLMTPVDAESFVHGGVFDGSGYAAASLQRLTERVPNMDSKELRQTQRRLARTGLPMSLLAAPLALVDNRLASLVDEYDPVAVIREQAISDGLRYEAVGDAVKLSPLTETQTGKQVYPSYGLPGTKTEFPVLDRRLNPEWTGAMAAAFSGLDEELADRRSDLLAEQAKLEAGSSEFSADSQERQRFDEFTKAVNVPLARVQGRINIREILASELSGLDLSQSEEVGTSLFKMGGGKDADTDGLKRSQAALAGGDAASLLSGLEAAVRGSLGSKLTPEMSAALSEEITMLSEVASKIVPMFDKAEDEDKLRRELKRQGILKTADTQYPELEVMAYFLANRNGL